MNPRLVDIIAGTRPNFVKVASIISAFDNLRRSREYEATVRNLEYRLIHTGQHFDQMMSGSFFRDLELPQPDKNLAAGGGSHGEQTGKMMAGYEAILRERRSDLVVVVGDVNSTLACAITGKKAGIPVAHVEGGIRSFDLRMPEEINRLATDAISDVFFTTSEYANQNLKREGKVEAQIRFVGNTMIDTLLRFRSRFRRPPLYDSSQLVDRGFWVMTLHRPANVDNPTVLKRIIKTVVAASKGRPIIFPVHPRTKKMIAQISIDFKQVVLCEPLGYLEFNYLVERAGCVITDSGGVSEETTVLSVPCITMRENTERPETVEVGTNVLVGESVEALEGFLDLASCGRWKSADIPPLWDGHAGRRITAHIIEELYSK
jgi:UDP-N-acetylglucosamine 2-epimerase (non-hydrolysing)